MFRPAMCKVSHLLQLTHKPHWWCSTNDVKGAQTLARASSEMSERKPRHLLFTAGFLGS